MSPEQVQQAIQQAKNEDAIRKAQTRQIVFNMQQNLLSYYIDVHVEQHETRPDFATLRMMAATAVKEGNRAGLALAEANGLIQLTDEDVANIEAEMQLGA